MSLTYDSAAQQLGVVRSTYARWVAPHGQPPRAVALACAALAAGLEPWPARHRFWVRRDIAAKFGSYRDIFAAHGVKFEDEG